jgi:hypothetical protein|nr:hypothetical protein [Kofleriaceae bacterium]
MRVFAAVVVIIGCGSGPHAASDSSIADTSGARDSGGDAAAVDWPIAVDPSAPPAGALAPALLGHYDLSGALFDYASNAQLASRMQAIGFADWRVGVGRWEMTTRLLPSLTTGSACDLSAYPAVLAAPAGSTDASLVASRDWFTDTGSAVALADTADPARYSLDYVRSVLDEAAAFGATPYVDLDHDPRALSANRTFARGAIVGGITDPCFATWTNSVSNTRPADPTVFAAAAANLVRLVVEGDATHAPRVAPTWEFWNEPELGYAWDQDFEQPTGSLNAFFATAIDTMIALASYRASATAPAAKQLRFGLGSFARASTAAGVLSSFDANPLPDGSHVPLDFVSFHSYDNDPLVVVADIATVAAARDASTNYRSAGLALTEWGPNLATPPDPAHIDQALHAAVVIARGAALGLERADRSLFYDFVPGVPYSLVHQDGSVNPSYYAYVLLHALIGAGADRLAVAAAPDGAFDGGAGAVVVGRTADGTIRALLVNTGSAPRTAQLSLAGAASTPARVQVFDDPTAEPRDVAPTAVVTVPARAIVLVSL